MLGLPFVLHAAQLNPARGETPGRDVPTSEDPLPAALEIDAGGYVLARETRLTQVRHETTDDN
jgi:hypothetical protein